MTADKGERESQSRPAGVMIYGATGSVGTSALTVIRQHTGRMRVVALTARSKLLELLELCIEFDPAYAVITHPVPGSLDAARQLLKARGCPTELRDGPDALTELARHADYDVLLGAITGSAGLAANLEAARRGKRLAIANKESLVMAGGPLTAIARETGAELLPVDSEHSAIWQCLRGENPGEVRRVILTASGGPFRTFTRSQLKSVTREQALKHPTWDMGPKITVDSSTLVNKALELIEARWLFDLRREQLDVVVHPQSIIHSMVEFEDRSIMAQLGPTDMQIPIQIALSAPERWPLRMTPMDFTKPVGLTFEPLDHGKFPAVGLGLQVAAVGGTSGAVFNAANEVAVERFLAGEIAWLEIYRCIERVLSRHEVVENPSLEEIVAADRWARVVARE